MAPRARASARAASRAAAPYLIEQAEQARGVAGERVAAAGEGLEEGLGVRAGVPEAIAAAQVVRAALLGGERGEVGVVLDPLAALVAAGVARDLGRAVEEAHDCVRRRRG